MLSQAKQFLFDATEFSTIDRGVFLLTRRNLLASLRCRGKANWIAHLLGPFLLLAAVGNGLGGYVRFQNLTTTYIDFIYPAILVLTATFIAYREMRSHSFSNSNQKKVWCYLMNTPTTLGSMALGEILSATLTSFSVTTIIFLLGQLIGFPHSLGAWLGLSVLFLVSWTASAFTMLLGTSKPIEKRLEFFFAICFLPGILFGETFFPLERWPNWFQSLVSFSPITHAVRIVRVLFHQELSSSILFSFALLLLLAGLFTNLAVAGFKRRVLLELME